MAIPTRRDSSSEENNGGLPDLGLPSISNNSGLPPIDTPTPDNNSNVNLDTPTNVDIDSSSISESADELPEEEKKKKGRTRIFKKRPPKEPESDFVDKKNMKLKPFGSRGRDVKVSEFDDRKDSRKKTLMVQRIVVTGMVLFLCLAVYSVFFAPKGLSVNDVVAINQKMTGRQGFPVERGRGLVTDFMSSYLNVNPEDKLASKILNYYYTGNLNSTNSSKREVTGSGKLVQKVIQGPTVYDVKEDTAYSASYVVGAMVQTSLAGSEPPPDGGTVQQNFYNVNVYYDKKKDIITIVPGSPTAVPPPQVGTSDSLPPENPLGTGEKSDELTKQVTPVIVGFLEAYAISTPNDYSSLQQYIVPDADNKLKNGLGGRYKFEGDDSRNAVKIAAYPSKTEGKVVVDVTVSWQDSVAENVSIKYKSSYVAMLQAQGNGKYLVSSFEPKHFFRKPAEK